MTGERKTNKKQAHRRPFSAFHTPTLDYLCSQMFPMNAEGPVIRPKYFPYNEPGQEQGGLKKKKARTCLKT